MEIDGQEESVIIAQEILKMRDEDQRLQKEGNWDEFALLAHQNTGRMKELVKKFGWPVVSKVGIDASDAAWILVQHSDDDVDFQESCLALMQFSPEGEVKKQNVAYLTDRVRRNRNLPQIFGTQFWTNENGEYEPYPIENPEEIDRRRVEVGLGTLSEYREIMEQFNKGNLKVDQPIKIRK